MKKNISFLILLIVFCRCSSVISEYNTYAVPVPEHFKKEILKKYESEKENYSLVYFTNNFKNDTITVSNIEGQIFKNDVSTVDLIGLARVIRIDNNLATKIYNKKHKCSFKIPSNKYKFIYINKLSNSKIKYKILYSNVLHSFM